jgi:hypothetical protein
MADLSSSFFVRIEGKQSGPYTGDQLREMVAHGKLRAEDEIHRVGGTRWHRVDTVKWLLPLLPSSVPSQDRPEPPPAPSQYVGQDSVRVPGPPVPQAPAPPLGQFPQTTHAQPLGCQPEETPGEQESGHLVRNVAIAAGGITVLLVALLIWPEVTRDRWELHNAERVSAKLDEADQLQQSEPLTAFKLYDELLKEAQQHKVTDERFLKRLASAEKSRSTLYPKVEKQMRAEEAEKQRQAEEEAKHAAEEKRRIAEAEQRKRAAEEAEKIAEEKKRAEDQRRKEAAAAYRNPSQSARNALNAVKKVEARTEVGLPYKDYSTVVGEGWADVKVFTESPEGKKLPEFSFLLVSAMGKYKLALDVWRDEIAEREIAPGLRDEVYNDVRQKCWEAAHRRIDMAESLITREDVTTGLLRVAKLRKTDATYEAAMRSQFSEAATLLLQANKKGNDAGLAEVYARREKAAGNPETQAKYEEDRAKYENEEKTLRQKRKEILERIEDIDKQDKQDTRGP